jgi:hypothetical protein
MNIDINEKLILATHEQIKKNGWPEETWLKLKFPAEITTWAIIKDGECRITSPNLLCTFNMCELVLPDDVKELAPKYFERKSDE